MADFALGLAASLIYWLVTYAAAVSYRDNYRRDNYKIADRIVIAIIVWFLVFLVQLVLRDTLFQSNQSRLGPPVSPGPALISAGIFYYFSGPKKAARTPKQPEPHTRTPTGQVHPSRSPPHQTAGGASGNNIPSSEIRGTLASTDYYMLAGKEILIGNVQPGMWARALVDAGPDEFAVKAHYVKLRIAELEKQATVLAQVERDRHALDQTESDEEQASIATHNGAAPVSGIPYRFSEASLSVYGEQHVKTLGDLLGSASPSVLRKTRETICEKIGWFAGKGDERAFLEAFHAQLRERLGSGP